MDEPVEDRFLRLSDDLVEEVFFRLPPDELACLVRASAVRKRWRRILADAGFRRRYCEFHGVPPVLGLFQEDTGFFTTTAHLPARPDRPRRHTAMMAVDCRHGRALITPFNRYFGDFGEGESFDLTVFDPLTGHQRRVPSPDNNVLWFSAAVLCAAQGCDHHGCQGGDFRVAFVTTDQQKSVTSGWLYSSQTRTWSKLSSAHHPNVTKYTFNRYVPSVLLCDAIYFNIDGVIKCDLGTLSLSMFERPTDVKGGRLMIAEDGGLGFAALVDVTDLTLWSMETGLEGAMGWAKLRVIDLDTLLPHGALSIPTADCVISGIAEGRQVIFISTFACYMVDLKSRRVRKVSSPTRKLFPYMRFYMPAMEAASTGKGQ
ncbi:hypothetical protein QYE76_061081 [Lolium multiflorum]|uniref:F-box protein AT5G49610-like beta-propeller domain-containing protein n=1 Tax=Lolium multiflorum TaxID=4521 RepID=A0AAD8W4D1_LOLMU|nr:hypothetical protein QYE76_061081 [Lolium multiflorum]